MSQAPLIPDSISSSENENSYSAHYSRDNACKKHSTQDD
jgi:hypothetical protein